MGVGLGVRGRDLDENVTRLGRPGNDLLSRVLRRSTIGSGAFHGRVRNGIGCSHPDIITRSAKERDMFVCARRLCPSVALDRRRRSVATGRSRCSRVATLFVWTPREAVQTNNWSLFSARREAHRVVLVARRTSLSGQDHTLSVATREAIRRLCLPKASKPTDGRARRAPINNEHCLMRAIKPIELLVPVSYTLCSASTPGLSTR